VETDAEKNQQKGKGGGNEVRLGRLYVKKKKKKKYGPRDGFPWFQNARGRVKHIPAKNPSPNRLREKKEDGTWGRDRQRRKGGAKGQCGGKSTIPCSLWGGKKRP